MDLPPRLDWPAAGIAAGWDVPPGRRVTRDNWRLYPYSRWAFQHARELVPSRGLPRVMNPEPFAGAPLDLNDRRFDDGAGGTIAWRDFLDRGFHDAVLVVHRGAILVEHYANGMAADTPHMVFSITKSLFGLAVERLIAAGAIDPGVRVGDPAPELRGSAFAEVTLRHLLDMTDGVAFDEAYGDADAQVHRYSAAYWMPAAGQAGTLGALPTLVERDAAPGTRFRYRTPVADAAALVVRRITGKRLSALLAEQVWGPAGCADDAYMLVDTAGTEIAGTGLNATARDLARIARWLLAPGQAALIATLLAGGDRDLFAQGDNPTRPNGSYRSFWWIDHGDPPTLTANGVYGQRLWLSPADGLAIVCLGSHPWASNSLTDPVHRAAFAMIRDAALSRGARCG